MEENKQWKQLPFTIELAKKIQSGEIEGRIVTNHGKVVTLVDAAYGFDEEYWIPIIWHWSTEQNQLVLYNSKGECKNSHSDCYLHIELPEETHKYDGLTQAQIKDIEAHNSRVQKLKSQYKIGDKVTIYFDEKKTHQQVKWVRQLYNGCTGKVKYVDERFEVVVVEFEQLETRGFYSDQIKHINEREFKPFDKVLVRDDNSEKWTPDIFRYYDDDNGDYHYPYRCCANDYRQCIPYTGNEHLLGTTNNPKEN